LKERILVTGATGFVGSHLIAKLDREKFDVFSFERYMTGRYVLGEARDVQTVFGDITDYWSVRHAVRTVKPDVVIHLASISPVAYSYDHPHEVMETNLFGTMNLVEACLRECPNMRQFLFASTSETYGDGPNPKTEETVQNPNSPYAVSKVASEKYLLYVHYAMNFPVTILRNFNTYGRKNNTHFVVERTIVQMLRGDTVQLGDPSPTRDFLYVDDHIDSYLRCLNNERSVGKVFNFCTGRDVSIAELVKIIRGLTDFNGEVNWNTIPRRPWDIACLVGDYSKASRELGWKPGYELEEGLRLTVDFWKDRPAKD